MRHKRSQAKPAPSGAPVAPPSRDVALIRGRTDDGEGLSVLRQRNDQLEFGAVRPLKEGMPVQGEVVTLKPRPEFPLLCDVDVAYAPPREAKDDVAQRSDGSRRGPPQVASDSYRQNWDAIWSHPDKKKKRALAN